MADVIYRNGIVLTLGDTRPVVQSLAIRTGRIVAIGSEAEVNGLLRRDTRIVDLAGAVILPGFHDAHVHLTSYGLGLGRLDLSGARSLNEALDLVRRVPAANDWLLGAGFSVARWGSERLTAATLDEIWPDRPVLLRSQDLHSAWLNSRALELTGITRDTADPAGGRIGRDADGNPSGLLFEAAAGLANSRVPAPDAAGLRAAVDAAGASLASMGITTVHHMAAEPPSYWRALADRASHSGYPLHVWSCIPQEDLESAAAIGVATGQGGNNFTIGGAKFFTDGALGSATAWFQEAYEGTDDTGVAMLEQEVLDLRIALAVETGLVPVIHAIGDGAVSATINALEACADSWRPLGMRPRIEHAQHITKADVARMARLGIIASVQPIHLTFDALNAERLLGQERTRQSYVFRQFLNAGISLAFGSDTPVAPPGVLAGLAAATSRVAQDGRVFQQQEAVTMDEALHAYTRGAARAIGREQRSGQLELGFDADLVILSDDPRGDLQHATVLQTVKNGHVTYDSGALKKRQGA